MNLRTLILIFFTLTQINEVFATAQFGDLLIISKDTFEINSNPLEGYFDKKGTRTINGEEMQGSCTVLWRGYVATWKLQNDSLFLVRIQKDYCGKNPIDLDVKKEFGTSNVFANWVNYTIIQPKGQLIQYVHMGYMSIYEQEVYYKFENGKIKNTEIKEYVKYNDKQIFPAERRLSDSIKKLILQEITIDERNQFDEESSCIVNVTFKKNGKIDKVEMIFNSEAPDLMEEIVLKKAKIALANYPKLMKVTHERYNPPTLDLFFSGHCLKSPKDREYGCNAE
jgi:hypothetical protein